MGRYYYGDIAGKYWVAIQPSNCMVNYGAQATKCYQYKECGCRVELEENLNSYCSECYDSFEEHKEDIHEDDEDDEDDELYQELEENKYRISIDVFDMYMKPVIERKSEWFNSIAELTFNKDEHYEYDIEFKYENMLFNENDFADYCMMLQIKKYFDETNNDICEWIGDD
jgi:hypothetical protein